MCVSGAEYPLPEKRKKKKKRRAAIVRVPNPSLLILSVGGGGCRLTNFNVGISVLSLFVLLIKLVAFIMKVWFPVVGVFYSAVMTILYAISVYGQAGPDYADPAQPSPVAWYIRMSCQPAAEYDAVGDCKLAKGTFGVTAYML